MEARAGHERARRLGRGTGAGGCARGGARASRAGLDHGRRRAHDERPQGARPLARRMTPRFTQLDLAEISFSATAALWEGGKHAGTDTSIFVVRTPPGGFVELHTHPYSET